MTHYFIHKEPKYLWLIRLFFPSADFDKGVIITYAPYIFSKGPLSHSLVAHELTHVRQQRFPFFWWFAYILSKRFRFNQELEAHRAEYNAITGTLNNFNKRMSLLAIADRLSGPLYNNMVSKEEARSLILNQ